MRAIAFSAIDPVQRAPCEILLLAEAHLTSQTPIAATMHNNINFNNAPWSCRSRKAKARERCFSCECSVSLTVSLVRFSFCDDAAHRARSTPPPGGPGRSDFYAARFDFSPAYTRVPPLHCAHAILYGGSPPTPPTRSATPTAVPDPVADSAFRTTSTVVTGVAPGSSARR